VKQQDHVKKTNLSHITVTRVKFNDIAKIGNGDNIDREDNIDSKYNIDSRDNIDSQD
jgi:hypothetical protein